MYSQEVTIQNEQGFHVRPAQVFVETASKFESDLKVRPENGVEVEAKSILGLMTLGLGKGATMTIIGNGADEEAAVKALVDLVESKFGEA